LRSWREPSEFQRHILTLAGGTTLAQALPLLASPVLTRLYEPAQFGVFALFVSITTVLSAPATLRYSLAIVIPDEDHRARAVFSLSLLVLASFSLVVLIAVLAGGARIAAAIGYGELGQWLVVVPVGVVLMEGLTVLLAWANRRRQYRLMAASRVAQFGSIAVLQLTAGIMNLGSGGLIAGFLLGQVIGVAILVPSITRSGMLTVPRVRELRAEASRFRTFPIFNMPGALVNIAANESPVLLLSHYFGAVVTGQYNLTTRVLAAPIGLVGTAVGNVFRERAAREYGRTGSCRRAYIETFRTLLLVGFAPFALVAAIGPQAFVVLFGEGWRSAGDYARLLVPLFFLRFVVSPLSYVLYITAKQAHDLVWQIGLFIVTAAALVIGATTGEGSSTVMLFSFSYSVMYIAYLVTSYRFSGAPVERPEEPGSRSW
jgi:O-antigen/teichoic acid export membrane protein